MGIFLLWKLGFPPPNVDSFGLLRSVKFNIIPRGSQPREIPTRIFAKLNIVYFSSNLLKKMITKIQMKAEGFGIVEILRSPPHPQY